MKKILPPISEETFSKFNGFINDVISRNETGSVIGLSQREQLFRVTQFLNRNNRPKKNRIKVVDLNSYLLEDSEDFKLQDLNLNETNIFLLVGADCLLKEKLSFLSFFNDLTKKNTPPSLIFFFRQNITYPWTLEKLSPYQYLLQNLYYYPAYKEKDQKQFLYYLEQKFKITIPTKVKNMICDECGGNFWLIKEAVRYFAKTKDSKGIFDHEEMNFRLQVLYNELEDKEKEAIKKIVREEQFLTDEDRIVADYFKKMNFSFPILNKFIAKQIAKEKTITLNKDKRIVVNSVVVDHFFSRKERAALRYFLSQKQKIISRDEIAAAVWGEDNSYSDWALDQFIRRLRNKYKKIGLKDDLVKTVKIKGFLFNI